VHLKDSFAYLLISAQMWKLLNVTGYTHEFYVNTKLNTYE